MKSGIENAKVILRHNQMSLFLQKMHSDPAFSKKVRAILRSGNERKLAAYLKKSGFKLG